MKVRKEKYQNQQTGEIKEFEVEIDENNLVPMYVFENGVEFKAVNEKWSLKVINSSEFFRSAHENTVRFKSDPLDGSDFPYGVT